MLEPRNDTFLIKIKCPPKISILNSTYNVSKYWFFFSSKRFLFAKHPKVKSCNRILVNFKFEIRVRNENELKRVYYMFVSQPSNFSENGRSIRQTRVRRKNSYFGRYTFVSPFFLSFSPLLSFSDVLSA